MTVTSTVAPPDGPGGTRVSRVVADVTVNDAGTDPNRTEVVPEKCAPNTVTCSPPAVGPLSGITAWTTGDMNVYTPAGTTALVPAAGPPVVTVTASLAADRTSGVTTVTEVGVWRVILAGMDPNRTVGTPVPNPLPLTTTLRPPVAGPDEESSPVTDGQPALDPENTPNRASARGDPQPDAKS